MNANQIIDSIERAELDNDLAADCRRILREQARYPLVAAVREGNAKTIADAMAEALIIAKMWGVNL